MRLNSNEVESRNHYTQLTVKPPPLTLSSGSVLVSITSIFRPYSSDTESETSSESNELPQRFSFSIETFFPPHRSPSHSDSSEKYEEIFPIDPFISTSSTRTLPTLVSMMFDRGVQVPNCTNPLSRNQLSHTAP